MDNVTDHDESLSMDAMTVEHPRVLTEREQSIYNAAYIKGRRDNAAEAQRAARS